MSPLGGMYAGGGSRGLAHLGVLQALDDLGVPVDVVGGTSQGAFMAALYAQGLTREQLLTRVRSYATAMSSPRRLLSDVTLPILSLFSGKLFDKVRSLRSASDVVCCPAAALRSGNCRAPPIYASAKQVTVCRASRRLPEGAWLADLS